MKYYYIIINIYIFIINIKLKMADISCAQIQKKLNELKIF